MHPPDSVQQQNAMLVAAEDSGGEDDNKENGALDEEMALVSDDDDAPPTTAAAERPAALIDRHREAKKKAYRASPSSKRVKGVVTAKVPLTPRQKLPRGSVGLRGAALPARDAAAPPAFARRGGLSGGSSTPSV